LPGQAVDTNVLAYAAGLRRVDADEIKIGQAEDLVNFLWGAELVIPVQALAELHYVLCRRARNSAAQATKKVEEYAAAARVISTDRTVLELAFSLTVAHGLQTFDAVILAAAAEADCEILYSEDMQDGFEWEGVRVVNPFA
jgi:predicted nucleic acid-binding protein